MKNKIIILLALAMVSACNNAESKTKNKELEAYYELDKRLENHFAEMEKIIDEQSKLHRKMMQQAFAATSSKDFKANKTAVKSSEDEENFYYQLEFSGIKKEEISVALQDDILTFSATQKSEKNNKFSGMNFYYSLSVSAFDKSVEPEIKRADDRIVVKLKKKK